MEELNKHTLVYVGRESEFPSTLDSAFDWDK
jgi:hypothetical protein